MAHGDTQRRGGELGDTSTLLSAQIAEDAGGAASDITVDSTTLTGVGTDVQAVLEELDDAVDAVVADVAALPSAPTVKKQAADLVIVAGAAQDTDFTQAVAANEVYAIQVIARLEAIDFGDSATLIPSGPAGSTWHFMANKVDEAGTVTTGHAEDGAAIAIVGAGSGAAMFAIHGIFTNGATPGTFKFTLDAGGAATLKKGSVMYIEHTA